ncbi:alpha-2-macroglobulin family protein [Reinekea marinisedimentorum]|uniref:Alpha-2-macroglobulin family protein n=1 Tax=Reinekea marinisedimentorum TaxID=230495 RepID=A0A4R3HWA3_9GAMM|nr:MG2 domain-containing protein [Reinekea marinisedimentorum]TCS36385.1 hypothetical protein BCF53_1257 [Reinekea marinisedimentorum]
MIKRFLQLWLTTLLAIGISSYSFSVTGFSDAWSEILLEHSILAQSRTKPVRIRFQEDVTRTHQAGQDASSLVSVNSQAPWSATFISPREIEISPKTAWVSGEEIEITLRASALPEQHQNLKDYQFRVNVIEQTYAIQLNGLTVSSQAPSLANFSGTLSTSDSETAIHAEAVLKATLDNQPIAIQWQHSANGRAHDFYINRIEKTDAQQTLRLSWNTETIGLNETGTRDITIPVKNHFAISSIHQYREGYPIIKVTFTNVLAADQNLNGLVKLNGKNFKAKADGNALLLNLPAQFKGRAEVTLAAGIEDEYGKALQNPVSKVLNISREKPQVAFIGSGVILPDNEFLSIPFKTINAHSVQVTAFEVFDNNIGQFLQSNQLTSSENMHRVGRYLWRKTIRLPNVTPEEWQNFSLDATELFEQSPGSLFRLTLSINRGNAMLSCTEEQTQAPVVKEQNFKNYDSDYMVEASSWDFAEDYFNINGNSGNSNDPCENSYYRWSENTQASKNFMASNIGLIAKGDSSNRYSVITTDIASSAPLNNTELEFYNFQNQVIATAKTDDEGFASISLPAKPFYLLAKYGKERGVLRLETNASLPVSHFDVGGQQISDGLKGTIFGERGVWRPGDDIFLTFVLSDEESSLPENHPVTMRLYDARNRLVDTQTNNTPVGNFYRFNFATEEEAITGNWEVRAQVGGATFSKKLKIETVQPNRLKVELDFGDENTLLYANQTIKGHVFSQWLHGATAAELSTDVAVSLSSQKTHFDRGADFIFDDATRQYRGYKQYLVDSTLDAEGHLQFEAEINRPANAPGMMNANFTTRVYESSGQFSMATQSERFSPFDHYVGIKLPKGDAARGMLLTDVDHTVDIVSLDAEGQPVALEEVAVSLHKISWRWWWEKGTDDLGQYNSRDYKQGMAHGVVKTNKQGLGSWSFNVSYPTWGRFLVRACDLEGGHCTSKVVYIDWPGWAGRAQESKGVGASALTLTTDKTNYSVGDTAQVTVPAAQQGRALVSIENGSGIVDQYWHELTEDNTTLDIAITEEMAPNVYVNVTLIQPHSGKTNDRPIRMYGIVPLLVENPETRLTPTLVVPEVWGSNKQAEITVAEQDGKPMAYTLMVVDEGLLGLTRYRTPDLHSDFYKKEALGVTSWDMFDDVVGAYGGELERLLALGGGDSEEDSEAETRKKRFPPVVRVLGPFTLAANESQTHSFDMPEYLGQVRVMVVASQDRAYGSASEQVYVREALNILPSIPRAVSPGEQIAVPTLIFRNDPSFDTANMTIEVLEGDATVAGEPTMQIHFDESNEQIALFNLNVGNSVGWAKIKVTAEAGDNQAVATVDLPIVAATSTTTQVINQKIEGGEQWSFSAEPHGLAGTNHTSLMLSGALPFNLDSRLNYLIRYPHGCIEQTTSAAFPQLYLNGLTNLTEEEIAQTEDNIRKALVRLTSFQTSNGGFAYWPGQGEANEWGTNYAGHFMIEAIDAGYSVPNELFSNWLDYQAEQANNWTASNQERSMTSQAYRLYTLVLANEPDLAAMNRLRVVPGLSKTAALILAEGYHRYGLANAAASLNTHLPSDFTEASDNSTYGSSVRNQAIALRSAVVRGKDQEAEQLATQLGEAMASNQWYSTQTIAYTLLAFSEYLEGGGVGVDARVRINTAKPFDVKSEKPVNTTDLNAVQDEPAQVEISNNMKRPLYASVLIEGLPEAGDEVAVANKLSLNLEWLDSDGNPLESVQSLTQGNDIRLIVTVSNDTDRDVDNLALTKAFPSGWEIENKRFEGELSDDAFDYQDIRDDRVHTYFSLKAGEQRSFNVALHSTYAGIFYLPGVHVEAMYDNTYQASTVGQWVEVIR